MPLDLEEERYIHEDLERLEKVIADRLRDDPKHVSISSHLRRGDLPGAAFDHLKHKIRNRLNRDHEIAQFLDQMKQQSKNLIRIYTDCAEAKARELEQMQTGDPFAQFYGQLNELREHHARYPNEQAENSELRYKPKQSDDSTGLMPSIVDTLFSGEEAYGRFFDLNTCHEAFLNLPNIKRISYLQYLDNFDNFTPGHGDLKRVEKLTDQYFKYLGDLAQYLTSFRERIRPLEDTRKVLDEFDREFRAAWDKDEVQGWQLETAGTSKNPDAEATWCADCEKLFTNKNIYTNHLDGRKHKRAAERRKRRQQGDGEGVSEQGRRTVSATRIKERAVAEREHRVKRLAASMSTERSDTRVNVERKQGMTERERQQELENLLNTSEEPRAGDQNGVEGGEEGEDKIYNPLKLPLAWDGKPIPFWLYRLHGLGVEFHCEICGNFVYMGRRAFDKHFGEPRHIYGLKCLGITNVTLFRDITKIEEALNLWDKLQQEQKNSKVDEGSIVQMEDGEGNVMPEKVYNDLQKQGLL